MFRILLFGFGAWLAFSTIRQKQLEKSQRTRSAKAVGTVVDYEVSSFRGAIIYSPIVRFTTDLDETITFVDGDGSSFRDHEPGDEVDVWYVPDDPHTAGLACSAGYTWGSALMILIGALLMLGAVYYRS